MGNSRFKPCHSQTFQHKSLDSAPTEVILMSSKKNCGCGQDPCKTYGAETFEAIHDGRISKKELDTLYSYVEYLEGKCGGNQYDEFIDAGLDPYRTNDAEEYESILGQKVKIGSKKHQILTSQVKHFNDLDSHSAETFDASKGMYMTGKQVDNYLNMQQEIKELRAFKKLVSDTVKQQDGPHLRAMLKELLSDGFFNAESYRDSEGRFAEKPLLTGSVIGGLALGLMYFMGRK